MSEADLRKMLFDKTNGKTYGTADWTKTQLISALRRIEQEEEEQEMLRNAQDSSSNEPSVVQLDSDVHETPNIRTEKMPAQAEKTTAEKGNRRTRLASQQQQQQQSNSASASSSGNYANTKLRSSTGGKVHEVLVLYCTGCGYAKYFVNMKAFLEENLPNADAVDIHGDNYPAPTSNIILAQLCSFSFIGLMAIALMSSQLRFLPENVRTTIENRRGTILAVAFGINILGSTVSQTGAYEVYVDNKLIYSKLATGTAPDNNYIKDMILQVLQENK